MTLTVSHPPRSPKHDQQALLSPPLQYIYLFLSKRGDLSHFLLDCVTLDERHPRTLVTSLRQLGVARSTSSLAATQGTQVFSLVGQTLRVVAATVPCNCHRLWRTRSTLRCRLVDSQPSLVSSLNSKTEGSWVVCNSLPTTASTSCRWPLLPLAIPYRPLSHPIGVLPGRRNSNWFPLLQPSLN